ncbi:Glutamate synthase [NADPH] large chain [Labilithrix luteola]|uniref:Glutamate synthase [NADPH] large chain n=1 Tax=Labilithrix luteola TaxID=1391654 RepID=A0A0K1PVW0_9BACT|nr:glutamate synthase large subunit [Labilithrix luteola]AKU97670.1 Glutamate synthase [NADPH] large chain [Labilithrix luteola]
MRPPFPPPSASKVPESLPESLYEPSFEHDACGLGFVVDLQKGASHRTVEMGVEILRRLAHRGAAGADPNTSDGAGILVQIPHRYFERVLAKDGKELPLAGDYGVAQCFLSRDPVKSQLQMKAFMDVARYHNQKVVGWRDVPVDIRAVGPVARASMPVMRQLFIARMCDRAAFERTLFMIRKRASKMCATKGYGDDFYVASCSSKTVVYKGLMRPERLTDFYRDLLADDFESQLALVHSRFSTNTFPTWERAHPYRRIAHNGEINTLRGNQNWMRARESLLASQHFEEHIEDFKPIIRPGGSDSASLDNVVDFLVAGGRSLPHVMMMLVPEAWSTQPDMPRHKRDFYEYHASLVEPWDGPAALAFTDGEMIGATLDRNGLRPAKYVVTKSGLVVMASELGVLSFEPSDIAEKGRLQPGKMFLVDTKRKCIVSDEEIKREVASTQPYGEWVEKNKIELKDLPDVPALFSIDRHERERLLRAFGYTREDLRVLLGPMALTGEEPVGSMGTDVPLAVLSERPVSLFRYFKQQFAQVTNPPIDPIREDLVMSLVSCVGGEGNLLAETPEQCHLLELPHPILTNGDMAKIVRGAGDFRVSVLPAHFAAVSENPEAALREALATLRAAASRAVDDGAKILVVSDRAVSADMAPIPSLLAVSAVHHHLIREGKRVRVGIVAETGDAREVADVALLIGYGAGAVNPYLAFESIAEMVHDHALERDVELAVAQKNYVNALKKGLLKVMSKMGISTIASYHGAQIFEALGVSNEVIEEYFTGTASPLSGVGLDVIANEALERHATGFASGVDEARLQEDLHVGGVYAWRATGERHLWTPDSIASLQKAVRLEDAKSYAEYARHINEQTERPVTLRGQLDLVPYGPAVPIDEVEEARSIVKRFATGAMSFGSISKEAHENLAVAMNRIGGRSNTGEGGEDEARYVRDARGDVRRSSVKQVASARFGVTTHYLVNADEIQIKMAQGAKPGEGGQLPGHKVDSVIARVRHSTPGVTLISPPPHHDIYSIEDLAQLIFDLKNVNPRARISVKLVSESGVGTIAAGVAKAHADVILISGHDGGTGASPLSSIQHAGTPWELGLAEAQQVLLLNDLRSRVILQADGQLKTGRDVAFAALFGAEEFGFATAPLVAQGCIMMRKCHLNTCPVGIATQDPTLRAKFQGQPEHVINYFFFVAEELRQIMATLGFRSVEDMVGRVECVTPRERRGKAHTLDFGRMLAKPKPGLTLHNETEQDHGIYHVADRTLIDCARPALDRREPVRISFGITNAHRTFGAMLAGEVARRHGAQGLPEGTIGIEVTGTAGQSFGAFAAKGMTITLQGDANDYVGKGLSGGIVCVYPAIESTFVAADNVIVGNTVLYGATSGRAFFAGKAGERFAVRNSGATAVVEGAGDHACEYMTGGTVVVLGRTGRNFGAGMSGGVAFVYDDDNTFASRCNMGLVAIEPVAEDEDEATLHALLTEHVARTESVRARELLVGWPILRTRFKKVIPIEYKRILEQGRLAAANGGNADAPASASAKSSERHLKLVKG